MADSNAKMTQATPREVIISVVAGLLAPLLAIFLIVQLVLGIQADHKPDSSSEVAQKATLERIKPFAQLAALDASAPVVEKSGQEVYEAACVACHGSGALGAPRFENKGDWSARIGQGYDTLIKNAIAGIRQMPPRGGNADLTDAEVARAVAYMANAAGAGFKAPEAEAPGAGGARQTGAHEGRGGGRRPRRPPPRPRRRSSLTRSRASRSIRPLARSATPPASPVHPSRATWWPGARV